MKEYKEIEFEDQFDDGVLDRGYSYYQEHRIGNIHHYGNKFFAEAYGTNLYNICVEIEQNRFVKGKCTCPYFSSMDNCKHIAGLLYAITDEDSDYLIAEDSDISVILDKVPEDELKRFVIEEFKMVDYEMDFRSAFKKIYFEEYKNIVSKELEDYLVAPTNEKWKTLKSHMLQCINSSGSEFVLNIIFEKIFPLANEYDELFQLIESCLKNSDKETYDYAYEKIISCLENERINQRETINDILINYYSTKMVTTLEIIESKIDYVKDSSKSIYNILVDQYLTLLKKTSSNEDYSISFCSTHIFCFSAYKELVSYYRMNMMSNHISELENKMLENNNISNYKEVLKDIVFNSNNDSNIVRAGLTLLIDYKEDDIKTFYKIQPMLNNYQKRVLINNLRSDFTRKEFYLTVLAVLNQSNDLYAELVKGDIALLPKHRIKAMAKSNPEAVKKAYENYIIALSNNIKTNQDMFVIANLFEDYGMVFENRNYQMTLLNSLKQINVDNRLISLLMHRLV